MRICKNNFTNSLGKTVWIFVHFIFISLTTTNETIEEKCEELRKQIEELHREVEIERRKNERLQIEQRMKKDETVTATTNICSREPDVSGAFVIFIYFAKFSTIWLLIGYHCIVFMY